MNRIFATGLAAAVGCSIAVGAAAQDTIEIDYFFWSPDRMALEQRLVDAYMAANPGVTITVQAQPPSDYWPRMSALAAAGDLPDVFYMSSGFIEEWQGNGLLANLQPYVDQLDLADYYTGTFGPARFPDSETGDMYAFPVNWVGPVLFYNRDAFDIAGLDYPSNDWGWDDFLAAAQALTVDENGDGRAEQYSFWAYGRYAQIEPWIYRNGGRLLNAEGTRLEPTAEAVEALRFLTDLTVEHGVAPSPAEMEGIRQQDVFPMGLAAMWVDGSWNVANTRTVAGDDFDWGIALVPQGPSATPDTVRAYTWVDMLAMSPDTEHPEQVWDFIRFMTSGQRDATDFAGGMVPSNRLTAESEAWLERDQQPGNKDVILELGAMPGTTSFTQGWSEWRGYGPADSGGMNGELDEVFNGRKTLDEAMAAFVDFGNSVLARYYP